MKSLQQFIIALAMAGALIIGHSFDASAQLCESRFLPPEVNPVITQIEDSEPSQSQSEVQDELFNQRLSGGTLLNRVFARSNHALQKLKFFLKNRRTVQFNSALFDETKNRLKDLESLTEVSIESLDSPEAILAFIETQSAINGQTSVDFQGLQENDPRLLRKVIRKIKKHFPLETPENAGSLRQGIASFRNFLRPNGFSELDLLKIFTDVYFAANSLDYPRALDVKFHYLNIPVPRTRIFPDRFRIPTPIPRSMRINQRKEELAKINKLIQLRAEYAAGKHGIVKGLRDMGLEFKYTPRNVSQAILNRAAPLAETMLWAPKLLAQLLVGWNFQHMAHETITNPAYIGKPQYVEKLLNEGWDAVEGEVTSSWFYKILAWTQVGSQKLIDKAMQALRIVMFYYIAFGLNSAGYDYGYIPHIYVPTLGEFQQLMNDPVYGSFEVSSKIEELISFYRNQCVGECTIEQEAYILVDLFNHLGVQDGTPQTATYFFPPERSELSELVQWTISSSLGCGEAEFCPAPGVDIPTAEYILRTVPIELAEEMTELDRIRMQTRIDQPFLFTFY